MTDPDGELDDPTGLRRSNFRHPPEESAIHDDDELAAALAAETALYTTPITLPSPVLTDQDLAEMDEFEEEPEPSRGAEPDPPMASDRDPASDVHQEPDPEPSVPSAAAFVAAAGDAPANDAEIAATVKEEAQVAGTLGALTLLENELRRRDGLDPIEPEPLEIPSAAEVSAAIAAENAEAWSVAPPPDYSPPALVEPPILEPQVGEAPPPGSALALVEPPPLNLVQAPDGSRVDLNELPPPFGIEPVLLPPTDPASAPPPDVAAVPMTPPPFDALLAGEPPAAYEIDDDDDVIDEYDRVDPKMFLAASAVGIAAAPVAAAPVVGPPPGSAPVSPFAPESVVRPVTPAVAMDIAAPVAAPVAVEETTDAPALVVEGVDLDPTPLDRRVGRASRLFWLWFAVNSSIISLAVGATLFSFGMSLRQTIVGILAGVALSFLPLGLGTLAGKWSGQPIMVVSRASFGLIGNIVPAILAVLTRAFWGGVMLWLLAISIASWLVEMGWDLGLGRTIWTLIGLVVGFAIVTVVAYFGYALIMRVQMVLSIATGILVVAVIALTAGHLDFHTALMVGDGSWVLAIGAAVVVFSFVGLAWVHSSSDLARYQNPRGSGAASMLWATFGATLPAFLLIAWGAILAASSPTLGKGLASAPLTTIAELLPNWFPVPLLLAAGLGLLSSAVITIYSGGFALQSVGLRLGRAPATLVAAGLVLVIAVLLLLTGTDTRGVVRDIATTLAVPIAAWAGIFCAEMMIRNRRFHAPSLLIRGGVYPDVRWVNLIALVVITVIGLGFTTADVAGLTWEGYGLNLLGISAQDPVSMSDLGVLLALALGLVVPLVSAIPSIRAQEETRAGSSGAAS